MIEPFRRRPGARVQVAGAAHSVAAVAAGARQLEEPGALPAPALAGIGGGEPAAAPHTGILERPRRHPRQVAAHQRRETPLPRARHSPSLPNKSRRRSSIFPRCGSSAGSSATNLRSSRAPCRSGRHAPGLRRCRPCRLVSGRSPRSPSPGRRRRSDAPGHWFGFRHYWIPPPVPAVRTCRERAPRRRPSTADLPLRRLRRRCSFRRREPSRAARRGAAPPAVPRPDAGRARASPPACRVPRRPAARLRTTRPGTMPSAARRPPAPAARAASASPPPPRTTRSS